MPSLPPLSSSRLAGPRPLPLHLQQALLLWSNSGVLWPILKNASPESKTYWPTALKELVEQAKKEPLNDINLSKALTKLGHKRLEEFLDGILKYRKAPFHRNAPLPPTLWQEGTTRLLNYPRSASSSIVLLAIPSLINRYYVMDLLPGKSFLHFSAKAGLNVYAVDWDQPGKSEMNYTLADYIFRLERILDFLRKKESGPIFLLGYCMGGLLALALALRQQQKIGGLLALAAPFDFRIGQEALADRLAHFGQAIDPLLQQWGEMPVDLLQTCFASLDPVAILDKFRAFSRSTKEEADRHFIALEDWLNDGVPLPASVAKECLQDWYGLNKPFKRNWEIGGTVIDPAIFEKPSFFAIPSADRIVPPQSARALAMAVPGAHIMEPRAGHIGMMVGSRAQQILWQPLCDWIHKEALS